MCKQGGRKHCSYVVYHKVYKEHSSLDYIFDGLVYLPPFGKKSFFSFTHPPFILLLWAVSRFSYGCCLHVLLLTVHAPTPSCPLVFIFLLNTPCFLGNFIYVWLSGICVIDLQSGRSPSHHTERYTHRATYGT